MAMRWAVMIVLLLAVLVSAMGVVYTQHTSRRLFAAIQELKSEHDELLTQFGQLQLEQSTWSTHGRVERIANKQLQMHIPQFREVKIVYSGQ